MADQDTQAIATAIVRRLAAEGYTAYFAGGWVRDYLLGYPSADIDIATSATPEEVCRLFTKTVPVGAAFGVVMVVEQGQSFEVASFRTEGRYLDGRHPETVEYASPEEDAQRRDFTINGLFYDPIEERIYDFVEGERDLKRGVVRAIGDPSRRFEEDRLRMLRAVRMAMRFDFTLDPGTERAIATHAQTLFPSVAIERVWQELVKMSEAPTFDQALVMLHRLGLLEVILPDLKEVPLEEIKFRVACFPRLPAGCSTILLLTQLFPQGTEAQIRGLCETFKLSNRDTQMAEFYLEARRRVLETPNGQVTPAQWAKFYANPLAQTVLQIFAARLPPEEQYRFLLAHGRREEQLHPHIERIKEGTPLVTAALLKAEGIEPGPQMGELLREAEQLTIAQDLSRPEEVIALLRKTPAWETR